MKKYVTPFAIFLFLFVVTACGGSEEPTAVPVVTTPLPPSTSTPTPGAGIESIAALQATPWQWISYLDQATGTTNIADPQNYIVAFLPDGTVQIKADCNNAAGNYTTSGDSLTIALGPTTLAACSPASQSEKFLNLLSGAAKYAIANNQLRIDLIADSGNLTFIPQSAPPPTMVPATAVPPTSAAPPPAGSGVDTGPRQHANGTYQAPYYTVAAGDTVYSIGLRFGLTNEQIFAANPNARNGIYTGQTLLISTTASVAPTTAPVVPTVPPTYERITFAPDTISATLNGSINNNQPKQYVLRALAGQTMTITTQSAAEPLQISVQDSNGAPLSVNGVNSQINNNVSVLLPVTGDYFITIITTSPPESPSLSFTITIVVQ